MPMRWALAPLCELRLARIGNGGPARSWPAADPAAGQIRLPALRVRKSAELVAMLRTSPLPSPATVGFPQSRNKLGKVRNQAVP